MVCTPMSVVVEFSKKGNANLFLFHVRPRTRDRIQCADWTFREGREVSANDSVCFNVR